MDVIFPIYKQWNRMFHEEQIMGNNMRHSSKKYLRYKKPFEFKVLFPTELKEGDKVYIYEPKKHRGCGKVIGHFTVGPVLNCNTPFGAVFAIEYFCREILHNEEYADKFKKAISTELPGYKKGYVLKYALDPKSMDHIKKYGTPPDIVDYLYDKERTRNLDDSEDVWKLCDEWLSKIGFYDQFGSSPYNYAITVTDYVQYDTPVALSSFTRPNGQTVETAPQSFMYVQPLLQKG